jgi:thiol-disulfide isomerase/thioredoxin
MVISGCEDESSKRIKALKSDNISNTTTQKSLSNLKKIEEIQSVESVKIESEPLRSTIIIQKRVQMPKPKLPAHFIIQDVDKRVSKIDILKDRVLFHKIKQRIVLLTIFSDNSPPCRGMLPYLNDLQKREKKSIFVIGILVNSQMSEKGLREFMKRYGLSFFISTYKTNRKLADTLAGVLELPKNYKIPLTIIYKNGKYIIHLSGASPPEMIQNIIDQLK